MSFFGKIKAGVSGAAHSAGVGAKKVQINMQIRSVLAVR
jgi:hypothetical protein